MVSRAFPGILQGESIMARLKKAPGRIIGRWKQEAIAANPGASDEDLAAIINDMAKKQGYRYAIAPEKVRARKGKRRRRRTKVAAAAASTTSPAVPKRVSTDGINLADIRAVKGLVDRIGAEKVQELAGVLSS
jgi:hypothetical protein